MEEIYKTLAEAMLLVILVVFVFLQGWRATLIPLCAVPVSLVSTFAVFPLLGFSVNTLSLLGLVLAIGLVVDDAIVVVEAVEHHIEHGLSPRDAALKAMEEVSGPVMAIALILAAVFIPTAFIPGITGRLVSAVCGDDCRFRYFLGVQCSDLEPRAGSTAFAAQERVPRAVGLFLQGIQQSLRIGDQRLCWCLSPFDATRYFLHFIFNPGHGGIGLAWWKDSVRIRSD